MNGRKYVAILASYCEPRAPVLRLVQRLEKLLDCQVLEEEGTPASVYDAALRSREALGSDVLIWLSPRLHTTAAAVQQLLDAFEQLSTAAVVSGVSLPVGAALRGEWAPNFTLADPDLGRIALGGETSGLVACRRVSLDFAVSRVLHPEFVKTGGLVDADPTTTLYLDTRTVAGVVCEFPVYPHHVAEVRR